jgi:hypothetical protein
VIVRILGEGQYSIPDGERGTLEALDTAVAEAVDSGDEAAFAPALAALSAAVRKLGQPLADDAFAPSDLVVPFPDATLQETKRLLAEPSDASATEDP